MNPREELEILKRGVEYALDCFYEKDSKLIRLKVNEPTLVGNFYRYFCEAIPELLADRRLRVDLEYDRCGEDGDQKARQSGSEHDTERPDMVVHRRGNSTRNVCMFEFKRYDSKVNRDEDFAKLREAVDPYWLRYHFGCFIEFGKNRLSSKVTWFCPERIGREWEDEVCPFV